MLEDILYPNEKEIFCTKYRIGFVRIGEAVRGLHPKSKAIVLSAIRQSGFTKEDLRELNWTFSSHLWNVGNFSLPGRYFSALRRNDEIHPFSDWAGIQTEDHSYPTPGMMTYSTHSSSTTTTTMPPVPEDHGGRMSMMNRPPMPVPGQQQHNYMNQQVRLSTRTGQFFIPELRS